MMKKIGLLSAILLLNSCMTLNGDYHLVALDENGNELAPNVKMMAHGTGIYTVKNALCSAFPKATVRIYDIKTNEELKGKSPRKCR